MEQTTTPVFNDTPAFAKGEVFQLSDVLETRSEPWFNQSLVGANESVLRVAKLHGEFHHHSHDTDEFFFVLDGTMQIEIDGAMHTLSAGMGVSIPAGVVHRTRSEAPATVLLVAADGAGMAGDPR
ncbi:MAG: cupin domain-containing protein [Pseudomonadota bacterium]